MAWSLLATTMASWSTSVSHGRSVSPFHWPVLAFSYSLFSAGRAPLVVPREDGVGVVRHGVDDRVDVGVGDGEDRLEVVDVGPADDLFVGRHDNYLPWGVVGGNAGRTNVRTKSARGPPRRSRSTKRDGDRKYEMTTRASHSASRAGRLAADVGREHRGEEERGGAEDARQTGNGQLGDDLAGLGGQHELEVLVGPEHRGWRARRPAPRGPRSRRRPAELRVRSDMNSWSRGRAARRRGRPGRRGTGGRAWPGSTPASPAMSSTVTLATPQRSQQALAASSTRSPGQVVAEAPSAR